MVSEDTRNHSMRTIIAHICMIGLFLPVYALTAESEDAHPLMASKYWAQVGVYFSARDFTASAKGSVGDSVRSIDFDSRAGLDDQPDLFIAEVGWQFSRRWGLALQHFESERSASRILSSAIEWQDLVFDAGVQIEAETSVKITRLFFARQFRDKGPHSLRLGAGLHWLSLGAGLAGEATLNELTREFRRGVVKANVPMPNIGAWYRYSPSHRWIFNVRADWLSASVDKYNGRIWNAAAGINYSPWDRVGFGLSYQFFQLDGRISEDGWRGNVQTSFSGPVVHISGHW
jgi:hypothetical protein